MILESNTSAWRASFNPGGLATGIGSLPFTDAHESVGFVRNHFPKIPHWPQMPQLGRQEHFIFQFLKPLVDIGLIVEKNGKYFFDTSRIDWPDLLTEFYTLSLAAEEGDPGAFERFVPPMESARGFHALLNDIQTRGSQGIQYIKGQIVGPLTVGFQLKDEKGNYAYYQDDLRDVIVRTLAQGARCQASLLSQFGAPAIIFVDEPCVAAYGSLLHLALSREMIIGDLNALSHAIHAGNALAGVHACEAVDWPLLFESDLDIVSLDAYRYGNSLFYYPLEVKAFLEKGGVLAWGIVPTLDDPFSEDVTSLFTKLERRIAQLMGCGLSRKQILSQSMITPACGTGLLSEKQVKKIYELTTGLSEKVISNV
jgi:hypothetical protein